MIFNKIYLTKYHMREGFLWGLLMEKLLWKELIT